MLGVTFLFIAIHYKEIISDRVFAFLCGLIVAGGIYNFAERYFNYCVLDYFRLGSIYFNLADIAIVIGVVFLLIYKYGITKESIDH
jgi:lipoprotein signal peptidase